MRMSVVTIGNDELPIYVNAENTYDCLRKLLQIVLVFTQKDLLNIVLDFTQKYDTPSIGNFADGRK